ncbi:hypothetical protein EMCG_01808 [[Emmonsia] crescens]|uniref:Uncharacterized protein n=1 Tax=[Emmonsia] crescens TaxID=73230 RepID=A0A0G2I137_9EURO|nr:hypothetical protein EMCG_01808 [Emmonsia crescens UAMH 3008]
MAKLSPDESDIIKNHPLTKSLNDLRGLLQEAERFHELRSISYDGAVDNLDQQNAISKLLYVLQGEDAALIIRSRISDGDLASDLARLFERLRKETGNFRYDHYRPLVRLVFERPLPTESQNVKTWNFNVWNAVLDLIDTASQMTPPPCLISSIQQTPWLRNIKELGELHIDIPGFFHAFFEDIPQLKTVSQAVLETCKRADNPLYDEEKGWQGWPELAVEKDVLKWLANIIAELVQLAEAQEPSWKIDRRPLAQPSQPLQGSVAERKLDIGFVNDPTATEDSRCSWTQILVPEELKNDLKYDRKSGA